MKSRVLPVKNVSRLKAAGDALMQRSMGLPGIGLISGPTGYGKTTAATWMVNQCHGVYIRAMRLWSPKTMLMNLMRELDLDPRAKNNGEMVEAIIQRLAETNRPIFLDEADYVVESSRLLDTLRDIHDMSTVPVILIGKDKLAARIKDEQFTGRVLEHAKVEFQGADIEDARILATGLAEVGIADDLLIRLHNDACPKDTKTKNTTGGAEIRRLLVGLSTIEYFARTRGMDNVTLEDWPEGKNFFVGAAAPNTPAPGKVARIGGR